MLTDRGLFLREVDDDLLAQLVDVATTDADADEVTPPLSPRIGWTSARVDWFEAYHRACRAGLAGPAREATWAIMLDRTPVGCVRLKRLGPDDELETGIWIRHAARGIGIGHRAMRAVPDEASLLGATSVHADTDVTNRACQALLRDVGFILSAPDGSGRIHGRAFVERALAPAGGRPRESRCT